jgi:hypothetical protein
MTPRCWSLCAFIALPLSVLSPAKGQMPSVRTLAGEVVIRSFARDRIVIAVDASNENKPADGVADSVFYFVADAPLAQPVALHFRFANLEARPRSLDVVVPIRGIVLWTEVGAAEKLGEVEGGDVDSLEDWAVAEEQARARLEGQTGGLILKDGVELTEYRGGLQLRLKDLATARDASKVKGVRRPGIDTWD